MESLKEIRFKSCPMQKTIDRYFKHTKEVLANKPETEEYIQGGFNFVIMSLLDQVV
ncbi:hypothetical protein Pint_17347 [Pistacia integerrima]|uniref:Uncharacterized protein n=1 Tax=Pistacia integerrima TaxID=434235 RepID=A0ACC0YYQ6_9ROSI|nr:hypothetical protein Pint_17347 [Pistacia integerrima]